MNFPLDLRFKLIAISRQIAVRDAMGGMICYVKQQAFKLKEAVTVYADEAQTQPLYRISADRIIDFNANYKIEDVSGRPVGQVARRGMQSFWRVNYEISGATGQPAFTIREANPWAKVGDHFFGRLPVVGLLSAYLFHPRYRVTRVGSGNPVMEAEKRPSLFEGVFRIDALEAMSPEDERLVLMSLIMMVLLERARG